MTDVHKTMQTVSGDTAACEAGIDIEEAKRCMEVEDRFDKKLYRDKIKAKHKVRGLSCRSC